jgi:invasion protein IalB
MLLSTASHAADSKGPQDWKVDCPKKEVCVAHLERKGVQILVGRVAPKGAVRMALRVSSGAKPSSPVGLRLSDGWQAGLKVGKCTASYCEAGVAEKSTSIALAAISRNSDGMVGYQLNNQILLIPVSFAGFSDALKRVSE